MGLSHPTLVPIWDAGPGLSGDPSPMAKSSDLPPAAMVQTCPLGLRGEEARLPVLSFHGSRCAYAGGSRSRCAGISTCLCTRLRSAYMHVHGRAQRTRVCTAELGKRVLPKARSSGSFVIQSRARPQAIHFHQLFQA